jgi:hypothetical protein
MVRDVMSTCCTGVWFARQYLLNTHVGSCHVDMCSCRGKGDECRTLLASRHIKALCREFRRKYGPWYWRKCVTKEDYFWASLTFVYNMTMKYPQDRTADLIVWVAVVYTFGKYTWSPFLLTCYFSIHTNETIRKSH